MKKRLLTVALAVSVLFSFTACDIFGILLHRNDEDETEPSESETTTVEETTTTEETTEATTTAEETTTEETTATQETTTEETASETTATPTPTKAPTKKPTKAPVKPTYVPKGYIKYYNGWGVKFKGKKIYIIESQSGTGYKGWYNGKWIKLYDTQKDLNEDGTEIRCYFYRDKKHKKLFYYNDDSA